MKDNGMQVAKIIESIVIEDSEFEEWVLQRASNATLVWQYLARMSPEKRQEALSQEGAIGDRLRQAMAHRNAFYEQFRKVFERDEAKRRRDQVRRWGRPLEPDERPGRRRQIRL
jgi:hypothetical protein